jgi:hypothetical protein
MGIELKENGRAAILALALVAAGLFWWHVADLTDCRNDVLTGGPASKYSFQKSACPKLGPYRAESSVLIFALLSPFSFLLPLNHGKISRENNG